MTRDSWRIRVETTLALSCGKDAFQLRASLRAWEGDDAICHREWNQNIPRDLL
jgi:hypothetical protein